jgi:Initiation factor 2 subunit family
MGACAWGSAQQLKGPLQVQIGTLTPRASSQLSTPQCVNTQVFLGAAAVHSNGTVMARIGSASVAMAADARGVPVIICCETYKFVAKVRRRSVAGPALLPQTRPKLPCRGCCSCALPMRAYDQPVDLCLLLCNRCSWTLSPATSWGTRGR